MLQARKYEAVVGGACNSAYKIGRHLTFRNRTARECETLDDRKLHKTGLAALRHCNRVDIIDEVKQWGEGRKLRLPTVMFPFKTREKAALQLFSIKKLVTIKRTSSEVLQKLGSLAGSMRLKIPYTWRCSFSGTISLHEIILFHFS